MLEYKNKLPFIENTALHEIIKVCETPFYVYSQEIITQKVEMTKKALSKNIFFSTKPHELNCYKLLESVNLS